MPQPDFEHISSSEVLVTTGGSIFMGFIRFLYLTRKGRKFKWFDFIAEPCFAVAAGMLVWLVCEATEVPDIMQLLLSQIGAWGGPKTIQLLEIRYLGELKKPQSPE